MITITELVCTRRPFLKEEELIALIYVDSVMASNVVLEPDRLRHFSVLHL